MSFRLDQQIKGHENPCISREFSRKNHFNIVEKNVVNSLNIFMLKSISMFQTNYNSQGRFQFSDYHFMISNHYLPKVVVNGKEIPPGRGLTAFNPGTEIFSDKTVKSNYYIAMRMDKSYMADIAQEMNIKSPLYYEKVSNRLAPELSNILSGALWELYNGQSCELMLDSFSVQIAVMLLRAMKDDIREYNRYTKVGYINKAIDYIHANLGGNVSIDDICSEIHISPFHFLREFKKNTGITPHQYLINARLDKALNLLKTKDMHLTEIALECGFSSPAHFSTAFKKEFGISPSAYR